MSKITIVLISLGLLAGAFAQSSCSAMFAGLTCRTGSDDPTKVDSNGVMNSRNWLCNAYPNLCTAISNGGTWSSCNSVQQLSYAMDLYYSQFKSQGSSACNFGGLGVIVTVASSTPAAAAPSATTATADQCSAMFAQASCRTKSQDPTQVDAGGVTSSRNWLCSVYPQFCLAINSGGAYSSCNSVQQLTYSMSLYYNQYSTQGTSACNFGGIGQVNTATSTPSTVAVVTPTTIAGSAVNCSAMFAGLTCRTLSQSPSGVSASAVSSARSWLCSAYPAVCAEINAGGKFSSCNSAEQMSYAMNLYYTQFSYQGSTACNFGGIGQVVSSTSGSGSSVVVGPAPAAQLSSKAGLAWPINQFSDGTNPPLAPWATGKISWIYTWSYDPAPIPISSTNLEWVAMLHSQQDAGNFIAKINSGAYDNVKNLLLFNEPDLNYPPYAYGLDVNSAISITLQVFQALQARGKSWRVGTPAMSYQIGWLQQYLAGVAAQCPTCKFSFVPVHCYTLDSNAFKATVQNYYNTFGLPIWVTEFADTDFNNRNWQVGLPDIKNFMSDTTNWLNAQSWVERYSWFGTMRAVDVQDKSNMVMNWDGSRNSLGDQYVLRGGSLN